MAHRGLGAAVGLAQGSEGLWGPGAVPGTQPGCQEPAGPGHALPVQHDQRLRAHPGDKGKLCLCPALKYLAWPERGKSSRHFCSDSSKRC